MELKLKLFMDYIDMRLAENVWNSEVIIEEIKALALTRPLPLNPLLKKELNLKTVATLPHGLAWFHGSIRVATGWC